MRFKRHTTTAVVTALAAAALPAAASANPPWTAPATVPGAISAPEETVFTQAGNGALLTRGASRPSGASSLLTQVTAAGAVSDTHPLDFAGSDLVTYASNRIVVAGQSVARSGPNAGTIDDNSRIVTRFGSPARLGSVHTVRGTKGHQLYDLASNRDGLMALVTGTSRTRTLFIRRPGSGRFSPRLRFRVSGRARGAAVAVGERGNVLLAYEDRHVVLARHIGRRGTVGSTHRLGRGVQSELKAAVNDDGRLEVAWKSQRVNEGQAGSPAIVRFCTAAPGHGFGPARKLATVGRTGAGRYVAAPAVELLEIGDDSLLAYTGFDGTNYTVQARQVRDGHLGAARRLSPEGTDAVLGDAAVDAKGSQVVTWRSGVAGADPVMLASGELAHTPVHANVRPAGGTFEAPELISAAGADVAGAPSIALDPRTGRSVVGYRLLTPAAVRIASRPAF